MRKLRRLPWRLPKQSAPTDHAPVDREEREERIERDRSALSQPVAYIAGRYVYSPAAGGHHADGPRRGLYGRHRTRAA